MNLIREIIMNVALKLNLTDAAKVDKSNKEIKMSDNLDPLEYFSRFLDIPEMIFHHFTGRDLIRISEVNPKYYNFIASSKALMENITVVFGKTRRLMNSEDNNVLKNSSRLYQSIEIRRRMVLYFPVKIEYEEELEILFSYITNLELECLQSKTHKWKNVSLTGVYFRKMFDLWNFLKSLESSVENISVLDFRNFPFEDPTSSIESFQTLKFPKLKRLKLFFGVDSKLSESFARFLLNSVSIEELDFDNYCELTGEGIVTKMLKNFKKLRSLKLRSGNLSQTLENESWKGFQFKLKSLTIIINDSFRHQPTYFRDFLETQSDHLETLSIDQYFDKETFDVIMKMPKLKRLCIHNFHDFFKNAIPNETSSSITELELSYCHFIDSLKFLLISMPNVRKIRIRLDDEDYEISLSTNEDFIVLGSKLTKIVIDKELIQL